MVTFEDGKFSFWTALYGSRANDARIVFRVRENSTPKLRAAEKEIKYYDRLVPSSTQEMIEWFLGHEDYRVLDADLDFILGLMGNQKMSAIGVKKG